MTLHLYFARRFMVMFAGVFAALGAKEVLMLKGAQGTEPFGGAHVHVPALAAVAARVAPAVPAGVSAAASAGFPAAARRCFDAAEEVEDARHPETVENLLAAAVVDHHSRPLEERQVLRNGLHICVDHVGQLAHAALSPRQLVDNEQAAGVGEGLGDAVEIGTQQFRVQHKSVQVGLGGPGHNVPRADQIVE